jgi:hypothetical protein
MFDCSDADTATVLETLSSDDKRFFKRSGATNKSIDDKIFELKD